MADLDPTCVQQTFDVAKQQREPHVIITARQMISGEVLKDLKAKRLVMR
jgi:hypothetical protein